MDNISEIFPIENILDQFVINADNVVSVIYSISYEEVFLKDTEYYNNLHLKIKNFIKRLPDYTIIQTTSMFDEETHQPEFHNAENFLQQKDALYYNKRSVPVQKELITISIAHQTLPKGLHKSSVMKSKKSLLKNPYDAYEKGLKEVKNKLTNIDISLRNAYEGCGIKMLKNKKAAAAIYQFTSMEYNDCNNHDFLLPSINFKTGMVSKYHVGVVSLYEGNKSKSYAKANLTDTSVVQSKVKQVQEIGDINQSLVFPLTIGLPFKHAYSCVIQKIPKKKVNLDFEFSERGLQLPAKFGMPSAINKLEEISTFKSLINEHDYAPVLQSMAVFIPEENQSLLNIKKEAVKSAASSVFEIKAIEEKEEASIVLFAHIPGNASAIYKHTLSTAFHAVSYLPKENHYKSDNQGHLFTDRFGKQILLQLINNPNTTNNNGIVIGPSGRGKSYMLNYVVSLLYNKGHLVIIDKGGSYKNLCHLLGGNYFDSADETQFKFSLFACEKNKHGNYIPDGLQYSYILAILSFIWKEGGKMRPEEKTILKEIIESYYLHINNKAKTPSLIDFSEFIQQEQKNFDPSFETYFDFKSFDLMMRPFTKGAEKFLLNSDQSLDLTYEKLSVFDMRSLEKSNPTKFSLLCIVISFLNIKKIQKLPRALYKGFIIDEALSFLKGDIGEFIGNLFAEGRKENAQVLVVAQGINYLKQTSDEVKEKIFSNRDVLIMTNHEGYENCFDDYKSLLGFTEKDIELLASVRKKEEIFIRLGNKPMVLRVEVSEEAHGAFSTHPPEMEKIKAYEKHYGSIQTAIEKFAVDKRKEKTTQAELETFQ